MLGGLKIKNPLPMSNFAISKQILPNKVVLPIFDDKAIVQVGDKVLTAQILTTGKNYITHASISGEIIKISNEFIPHQSALKINCITIKSDNKDEWIKPKQQNDFLLYTPNNLLTKLAQSGIIGLGGAGFSTNDKLHNIKNCHTIIINACECEPAIEADNSLMQEYPREILRGIDILLYITGAKLAIIVIENDKLDAFESLITLKSNHKIRLQLVDAIYGSGYEKSLIYSILNIKIASGKFASDYGILMQNIATVKAIFDFIIYGIPLIERVVTIAIDNKPKNKLIRVGTLINEITKQKIRVGGLMMGIDLPHNNYPILKTTNAIFIQDEDNKEVRECIRCGDCVKVCPANLLPQQIYWFAKNENIEKCITYNVMDCTECRCCDEVCGSNIPLSSYFSFAKRKHLNNLYEEELATRSNQRFEFREYRLERNKKERTEMMARKRKEIKAKMQKKALEKDNAVS